MRFASSPRLALEAFAVGRTCCPWHWKWMGGKWPQNRCLKMTLDLCGLETLHLSAKYVPCACCSKMAQIGGVWKWLPRRCWRDGRFVTEHFCLSRIWRSMIRNDKKHNKSSFTDVYRTGSRWNRMQTSKKKHRKQKVWRSRVSPDLERYNVYIIVCIYIYYIIYLHIICTQAYVYTSELTLFETVQMGWAIHTFASKYVYSKLKLSAKNEPTM